MEPVDEILAILEEKGGRQYGGERVTQLSHALQCAALAEREGASSALIAAALLHDIGHLINDDARAAIRRGEDAWHENRGHAYLRTWFDDAVTEPVRLHVAAKRFLTAREPGYFESLSEGSVRSLEVQGGPFSSPDADHFIAQPHAEDGVRLRRWDDRAKSMEASPPPLAHFRRHVEAGLKKPSAD